MIMSSEPLIDVIPLLKRPADGAMITQFDYPTCEALGLIKMDFLGLRNLTVLDDAVKQHRGQPRRDGRPRGARAHRRGDVRAAPARRHPRRLPARRRPDARAAALDAARHASRTSPRSARSTGPGPMGADSHNKYARRKTGREPVEPIHPELAEPLADDPGRDLRPDRLPGAGHGDRPEARGLHARPGRHPAPRDGQEEEGGAGQAVRRLLRRHDASAATPTRAVKTLWDILLPFSDYAFNKAHSAAYGLVSYWTAYLKANYPAEYMAALLTSVQGRQGQVGDLPQRVPPDEDPGAAARRQRVAADFTPVGNDIRFGLTAIRNVGSNVVDGDRGGARGEGPLRPTSTTSWTRSRRWSATSGSSSRWSRPAPSTT